MACPSGEFTDIALAMASSQKGQRDEHQAHIGQIPARRCARLGRAGYWVGFGTSGPNLAAPEPTSRFRDTGASVPIGFATATATALVASVRNGWSMLSEMLATMGTAAGAGGTDAYLPQPMAAVRIGRHQVRAVPRAAAATTRRTLSIAASRTACMAAVRNGR